MTCCCWICLVDRDGDDPPSPACACRPARPVHAACLARWRRFQLGTSEERACRFCGAEYDAPWTVGSNVAAVHVRVGRRTKVFSKAAIADAPAFRRTLTTNFPDAGDRDVRFDLGDGIEIRGWDKCDAVLKSLSSE